MFYIPDSKIASIASESNLPMSSGNLLETVAESIDEACRRGFKRTVVSVSSDFLCNIRAIREMLDELGYRTVIKTGGVDNTAATMMTDSHLYDYVHMDISW